MLESITNVITGAVFCSFGWFFFFKHVVHFKERFPLTLCVFSLVQRAAFKGELSNISRTVQLRGFFLFGLQHPRVLAAGLQTGKQKMETYSISYEQEVKVDFTQELCLIVTRLDVKWF